MERFVSLSTTTALKARAESVFATIPRKPPHEEISGQKLIRGAEIEVEEKIARLRALREVALTTDPTITKKKKRERK
jgi:hypothetical protein